MLSTKFKAYIVLTRPIICASAFFMAIVGYWLAIHHFDFTNINAYWGAISVSMAMAFANVLNDIFDAGGDQINYPDRPLPAGQVTLAEAWGLTGLYLALSLITGFVVGSRMFLFTIFLLMGSIIYDGWAHKIPILGKVIVAMLCALTVATGYFVVENGDFPLLPLLVAFLFVLARDLVETISDDAGDSAAGRLSLYALWGKKRLLLFCLGLILMAAILLLLPFFSAAVTYRWLYFFTVMLLLFLPVGLAAAAIWKDQSPANIRRVAHRVGIVFFSSIIVFLWLV